MTRQNRLFLSAAAALLSLSVPAKLVPFGLSLPAPRDPDADGVVRKRTRNPGAGTHRRRARERAERELNRTRQNLELFQELRAAGLVGPRGGTRQDRLVEL